MHLIKIAVGVDSIADLAQWQQQRLREMKRKRKVPELMHVTRNTPKSAEEILSAGSLFWVIKSMVCARQRIVELRPVSQDGIPHCGIVLDPKIIRVRPRPHRAFQGWRYLALKDAPADIGPFEGDKTSDELESELAELGLL